MWYTFDPSGDCLIRMKEGGGKLAVDQVKIGYSVEAWGEWIVLSSYPSQTAGLELNILSADISEPDLRGTIEEIWDIGYPNFANRLVATRIERIS